MQRPYRAPTDAGRGAERGTGYPAPGGGRLGTVQPHSADSWPPTAGTITPSPAQIASPRPIGLLISYLIAPSGREVASFSQYCSQSRPCPRRKITNTNTGSETKA